MFIPVNTVCLVQCLYWSWFSAQERRAVCSRLDCHRLPVKIQSEFKMCRQSVLGL